MSRKLTYSVKESIDVLRPILQARKLIVFVGSGISVPSGLPTWDGLLSGFIDFASNLQPHLSDDEKFIELIEDAKKQKDQYPARVALVLRNRLLEIEQNGIANVLRRFNMWLTDTLTGKPNDYHKFIVSTNYPFILTTNYDGLLESAADELGYFELGINSFSFDNAHKLAAAIYEEKPSIIHVHGDYTQIALEKFIFTADDYQIIEKNYPGFRLAIQSLFLQYSILFVGYGGSDPHFEKLMEEMAYWLGWSINKSLPRCFLVLKEGKAGEVLSRYKKRMRTDVITINDYDETHVLLEQLRDISPRRKHS